ncbi:MAG: phosphate ABC transporter permease subunit PstC [Thermoplasmata archaeon]|nr:phosphate ABC transporter permease subunit PstC [Thermoplasmata archaeon]
MLRRPRTPGRNFSSLLRRIFDLTFLGVTLGVALGLLALLTAFILVLVNASRLSIVRYGLALLGDPRWAPSSGQLGLLPFIDGTLITAAIALVIAVPISLGIAIFLSELAPRWISEPLGYLVELLAAVPSVIFGFWGIFVLIPLMRSTIDPALESVNTAASQALHVSIPLFTGPVLGSGVLTAGVILAIMIIPTISAIARDALRAVPQPQREAALGLGATQWEVTRISVLNYARIGIVAAVILGLGRAVGETMAVTMVIGNSDFIPNSLFSQGQTIASLIANEFLSTYSDPITASAFLEAALVLLLITLAINIGARLMVWRLVRSTGGGGIE